MSSASANQSAKGSRKGRSGFSFDKARSVKSDERTQRDDKPEVIILGKKASYLVAQLRKKIEASEKTAGPVLSQVKDKLVESEKLFTDVLGKSKKVASQVRQKAMDVKFTNIVALAKKTLSDRLKTSPK